MGSKFDIDTAGNFEKFLGKQHPKESVEESPKMVPLPEKTIVEKKNKPVQSSAKSAASKRVRKKGRPKANRELKSRYTFTIFPSIYEQAFDKADEEGFSISEVVSFLLEEYIRRD